MLAAGLPGAAAALRSSPKPFGGREQVFRIDRLAIGIEQIAKLLTWAGRAPLVRSNSPDLLPLLCDRLDAHKHMKVISQETVGIGVGNWLDIAGV